MYDIELSDKAKRQLNKFVKELRDRIGSVLKRVRIRPEAHFKKLIDSPYFFLRVGDYRVIADIDRGRLIILVIVIGYRKNGYK